ncbi:hypothetical protein Esi_1093_0001 [Ectocarpus siliculosus]|uniref:Protein kinase domain-containing protein n=1 Tax=Ectocarpus siliculosus TaxID=2880 RepID=D7FHN9_ECTSI|nr:hypothetical protein Esi_1093_0001 [Ectocarpus siliculosus]|eukprot:CBJ34138.1 hypothetical protein Esi_1093_0001 [Ectocarpus siliculosus]
MLASLRERLESGPVPSAFRFAGRGRGCPPDLSTSPTFSGTGAGTATEHGAATAAARPAVVARVAVTGDTGAVYSPCTPSSTGACTVDASSTDTSKVGDRFSRGGGVPAISPADRALPAWSSALSSSSSSGSREGADKNGAAASTVGEQSSCPMLASLRERLESGPVPSAFRFVGRGRGCPPHLSTSPTFSGTGAGTATEHGAATAAARPAVVARVAVTGDAGAVYSPCTPSSTGACTVDAPSTDTSKVGDRFSRGGGVPAISPADWALPAWSSALSSSSSSGSREGADKNGAAASTVGEQSSCPMLASLRERLESGPVPSAFRFAGRGRGCPPHLSTSPTFSGTVAGTATEHGAATAAARPAVVARVAVTGDTGAVYSPCTPSSTGACTVDASSTDTSKVGDRFSRGGGVPAISPADWALPAWSSALSSSSSSGSREGADKNGAAASTVGEQSSCPMLASLRERLESGPVPSAFRFAGRGRGCPPHLSASPMFSGTGAGTATEHGAATAAARPVVVARVAVTGDTGAVCSPCTPSSTGACTVDASSTDTSKVGDRFSRGGGVPAISPADWALPAWSSALSSSSSSGSREGADKNGAAASTVGEQSSCPMLASLRERLESGPVPSAFRFAGRGRGCSPHLSASPMFSGTGAGTATEHGAAAAAARPAAAAVGAVPAAAYGACASYSGCASHDGGDKRDFYVLENMDLLDDADEKTGTAASASRKDNDDGKMKTGAIYGNQSIDQSIAEALMGIGGRPALQVMRVSGLDAALTPSSGPSDSTEEEQEEASPAESKKRQRHRCEELDIDEDYLGKIDVMTEEVSSVVQKILAAAASVAPPTPPLTPASAMSSPADSFHGSTRAVFFGSGYNEKDSGVIFESVNADSPLLPQVVPRSPGVVDTPPPRFPSPRVYLTADGLNMDLCILDGVNSDGGFGDVVFMKDKTTKESFAFKKSKDTPSGRRQMEREVAALSDVRGKVSHVVHVQEISSTSGAPMLLMRREPGTLSSMLCDCSNTDPRALVR